jgi:A/G-specific adenine glycosylase
MDGNVRRVLSRLFAVTGRTGERAFESELWRLATLFTPMERVAQYTQAIMDLGATLCTRRQPRCGECPLMSRCVALAAGRQHDFPAPKKPLKRRQRETWMLFMQRADGAVKLTRRPEQGVWGGLWSPAEFDSRQSLEQALAGHSGDFALSEGEPLLHVFTHFDLLIHPLWARTGTGDAVAESASVLWYNAALDQRVGVPAPITQLLRNPPP